MFIKLFMNRLIVVTMIFLWTVGVAAQSPNSVIEEAADMLDQKLTGRRDELAADRNELYALIDEMLLPRFDRKYAAQLVLGKHWKTATDAQKTRFTDAFYTSLLHKYADGLLKYDSSRIEILEFRGDLSKPRTVVKTIVQLDDGTKVPVNYGMVKRDDNWLMFDVTIEGISYVRNFRAEMDSEINAGSLDAVINRLEAEVSSGNRG